MDKKCSRCKKIKNIKQFSFKICSRVQRISHCNECNKYNKIWYKNQEKPSQSTSLESGKKYLKNNPWMSHYNHAKQRCNNPNNHRYKNYGDRGIKFLLYKEDVEFLWFRDKAYNMENPSIDREDNDGNYELSNCRFIENMENSLKGNK